MPRVLFISGWGRSGSTLLDRILGQLPGFFSCGEIAQIWRRSLIENFPCGCHQPFDRCTFWRRVLEGVEERCGPLDPLQVEALELSLYRRRTLPLHLAPWQPPSFRRRREQFTKILSALYASIQETSQAEVIIDSSKHPLYALLLSQTPGIELYLLHLVRDSRAVAYSWSRRKLRVPIDGAEGGYMSRYSPLKSGVDWYTFNLLADALSRHGPSARIRYEDLVTDAPAQLRQAFQQLGLDGIPLDAVSRQEVRFGPNHIVGGNPMRFEQGPVALRLDDEWQRKMNALDKASVTLMSAPLLYRYHYPLY